MIARLARLERASLFFLNPGKDLVGNSFAHVEFFKARMIQLRIADFRLRISRCLEFFESPIYLLDTRKQRSDIGRLHLRLDESCDLFCEWV